jgi:hypothetical protein
MSFELNCLTMLAAALIEPIQYLADGLIDKLPFLSLTSQPNRGFVR